MAPEVVVPANFGKHHLKSRTHNNLELLCAEGEVKRANSMILSLNSSVIEDLIARLEITSLDMQDFAAPAVNCFVESMYSGELENCDKTNFRDLNKMGHVFDVTWFVERCLRYFDDLVNKVTGRCYEDVLFVAEEAWFVEENLKKNDLLESVIEKLDQMSDKKSRFLKKYAKDLSDISLDQLKMVVRIAGSDTGILASILATHLQGMGACRLSDDKTRYVFKNIDFVQCFSNPRYISKADKLFSILEKNSCEDFKFALECISSFAKKGIKTSPDPCKYPVMISYNSIDFLELDWDDLCHNLFSSKNVRNLYHFFEAFYTWFHFPKNDANVNTPRLDFSDHHYLEDIIEIKRDQGWSKISRGYLASVVACDERGTYKLVESFLESDELSSDDGVMFKSKLDYNIDVLLTSGFLKIALQSFDVDKMPDCTLSSRCGLMMNCYNRFRKRNRMDTRPIVHSPSFKFAVTDQGTDDRDSDVHFHNDISTNQPIGLLMEVRSGGDSYCTPFPFNISPCSYYDGPWDWGFHEFIVNWTSPKDPPCHFSYRHGAGASIKFIAFVSK